MRGDVEEIVARIDEEVEAFKTRLASPEAKVALAMFLNSEAVEFLSALRGCRD